MRLQGRPQEAPPIIYIYHIVGGGGILWSLLLTL